MSASAQHPAYPVLTHADSAEVWFDRLVNPKYAALVNGPEYYISFKGLKTHPFYQSSESARSAVRYDNDLYKNVDLLYDTYTDILVLKCATPNGIYLVKLNHNMVQDFYLHNHHFRKYNEGIRTGIGPYFDVLFEGKQFAIVAKRRKLERIEGGKSDYVEDDAHYILNNGQLIRITGKGSFSKTLSKEQRKDLDTFIRNNHIKLNARKEEDLKKLGAFCYALKKNK